MELAALAMADGVPLTAREQLDEAIREGEHADDRGRTAEATRALADALLALRDPAGAEEAYRRSAAMFEALPDPVRHADCLLQFADLLEERGEGPRAGAARALAEDGLRRAADADWPNAQKALDALRAR
jgi:tetratricopeptide (TPR) repeat protein